MNRVDNISDSSFNEDFCSHLEYHLGRTFKNSKRPDLRGFWCDGVSSSLIPEAQISKLRTNEIRNIETKAWIGRDGQDEYKMTIHFGEESFKRFVDGKDLVVSIPSDLSLDWVDIDTNKKTIEIRLN